MQNGTFTLEESLAVLLKLNFLLPYDPAIALLGIQLNEVKMYVHTKTCTKIFIVSLLIMAKTQKEPKGPAEGERKNKLQYIQIMEYFSALKNEQSSHEKTRMKLKCILLDERNQSESVTYYIILAM